MNKKFVTCILYLTPLFVCLSIFPMEVPQGENLFVIASISLLESLPNQEGQSKKVVIMENVFCNDDEFLKIQESHVQQMQSIIKQLSKRQNTTYFYIKLDKEKHQIYTQNEKTKDSIKKMLAKSGPLGVPISDALENSMKYDNIRYHSFVPSMEETEITILNIINNTLLKDPQVKNNHEEYRTLTLEKFVEFYEQQQKELLQKLSLSKLSEELKIKKHDKIKKIIFHLLSFVNHCKTVCKFDKTTTFTELMATSVRAHKVEENNFEADTEKPMKYTTKMGKSTKDTTAIITHDVERLKKISSALKEYTQYDGTILEELQIYLYKVYRLARSIAFLKLFSEHVDESNLFIIQNIILETSILKKLLINYFGFSITKKLKNVTEEKDLKGDFGLLKQPLVEFEKEILDFIGIQ